MAGAGAGITSAAIIGGLLCVGLFLLAIAAAVILSLIPTFTPNNSEQGYGSEFAFDAIMLKFSYDNSTGNLFDDGTVVYSAGLSQACTQEYASLGAKHLAGCLLYNGEVYGPYNTSNISRRRRQAANPAGMYYVGDGRVYFTTSCPAKADRDKYDNAAALTSCVRTALEVCNSIINRGRTDFDLWDATYPVTISAANTTNSSNFVQINTIYGVPSATAVALSSNLNLTNQTISDLQLGCRYVGPISIPNIIAILGSIPQTTNTTNSTSG